MGGGRGGVGGGGAFGPAEGLKSTRACAPD